MLRVMRLLFVILVMLTGLAVHLRNDQTVLFDYYLGTPSNAPVINARMSSRDSGVSNVPR